VEQNINWVSEYAWSSGLRRLIFGPTILSFLLEVGCVMLILDEVTVFSCESMFGRKKRDRAGQTHEILGPVNALTHLRKTRPHQLLKKKNWVAKDHNYGTDIIF
jgi:hypothetical protein